MRVIIFLICLGQMVMAFQINRPNTNTRLNTLNMINDDEPLSSKIMTYIGKGMAAALVLSTISGPIPSCFPSS